MILLISRFFNQKIDEDHQLNIEYFLYILLKDPLIGGKFFIKIQIFMAGVLQTDLHLMFL